MPPNSIPTNHFFFNSGPIKLKYSKNIMVRSELEAINKVYIKTNVFDKWFGSLNP